eukprot:155406-Rhodomonas_salina.5
MRFVVFDFGVYARATPCPVLTSRMALPDPRILAPAAGTIRGIRDQNARILAAACACCGSCVRVSGRCIRESWKQVAY